jgi:AraC family transcriptional regulator
MRCEDAGICSGSEMFVDTPSDLARDMLYYITSVGRFFTDYGYHIERADYHNYMLFYILSGRLSVTSEGRTLVAEAGQVGFLNCHTPHEYHTIGNTEFLWLHLDGGNTEKFYHHIMKLYGGFVFSHSCADEICNRLDRLFCSYQTGQLLNEVQKSAEIYMLLMRLIDGSAAERKDDKMVSILEASLQFMKRNLDKPITLLDISGAANMSQYHFSRLFKKVYGYSPYEYLLLARINKAKHLLKTTDAPVKVVAQQVGYLNASTFSSAFTAKTGLSPKAFREFPL